MCFVLTSKLGHVGFNWWAQRMLGAWHSVERIYQALLEVECDAWVKGTRTLVDGTMHRRLESLGAWDVWMSWMLDASVAQQFLRCHEWWWRTGWLVVSRVWSTPQWVPNCIEVLDLHCHSYCIVFIFIYTM